MSNELVTGRSCGSCSMCCKLFTIEEPELTKPGGQWCQHCKPGNGGCSIYQDRPPVCKGFRCLWLDGWFDDAWRPNKSKIVACVEIKGEKKVPVYQFHVDPSCPYRWKEEPYYSVIKRAAITGLSLPEDETFATWVVVSAERMFIILPSKEIERGKSLTEEQRKEIRAAHEEAMDEIELRKMVAA